MMFSTPARKPSLSARKNVAGVSNGNSTPITQNRKSVHEGSSVSKRPATGTPAHWASQLSGVARFPPAKRIDKGVGIDAAKPICVGEFPQLVRDAQLNSLQNRMLADACSFGGLDQEASLAWIIHGKRVFIWNYLSAMGSRNCTVLDLPPSTTEDGDAGRYSFQSKNVLGCIVNWDSLNKTGLRDFQKCRSAGFLLCDKKDGHLIFWPDIFSGGNISSPSFVVSTDLKSSKFLPINSLIASAVPNAANCCIALACSSAGMLWRIYCTPSGVDCNPIELHMPFQSGDYPHMANNNYPRSLIWLSFGPPEKPSKQFLLIYNHEIQCFEVKLSSGFAVVRLWSHKIISTDSDMGTEMDLVSHNGIYPLALDFDSDRKVFCTLIGVLRKDQVTGSYCSQYSLLTLQYKNGVDFKKPRGGIILEKKGPIQMIIPRAPVDDEEILFSMRLKVGGKPPGSAIILSGDGIASISHYQRSSPYQFNLPNDVGKVLDASVLPLLDESEDGVWVVLTEKAGIWAIPERAVLLGPERSLSLGTDNETSLHGERRGFSSGGSSLSRRSSLEGRDAGDKKMSGTGFPCQSSQDDESDALLNQLFNDFLLSGQVDGALVKLKNSRAFDKVGELNSFTKTSKSIVDTLAKHWTAARGSEILLSLVGSLLQEKQLKHQKFLQFLALSKCHEELCSKQRLSLQIILEHGEKISGMIHLRELQNMTSHSTASGQTSADVSDSGVIWNLVQLAGERTRRSSVLLMDRDNTEVFYTKVSDLEEIFFCLERQLDYLVCRDVPILDQARRACELSNACVHVLRGASDYRSEHHLWYPSPEGLLPWYAKTVICHGLSSIASFMLQLLGATNLLESSVYLELYSNLELLSEVLLESYSIAITAKSERKEEYEVILDEYRKLRDDLLQSLYQHVKKLALAKVQESAEENENKDLLLTLSSNLLSVARKHEAYQTMWSICDDLNDSELLHSMMLGSMGPKGGFCCFVFDRLYESKQLSKLMRLGEDFPDELSAFLKSHPDLLWRHEVFLHQFSSASETLHALSLSKDAISPSATEEDESISRGSCLSFRKRKHFLNLAKISAVAGRDAGCELKVKRIEADLNILRLQEEILKYTPDEERLSPGQNLLPPVDLIKLCLKIQNPELSLRAFDVFSWTSLSLLTNNLSLLEDCWMNAADQDDWGRLMSVTEGCTFERTVEVLKETALFKASSKCYGPEAEFSYVRFDEVIPLTRETVESKNMDDATPSVEAVLMQHRDYPYAGKLMLSSIVLGSRYGAGFVQGMDEEGWLNDITAPRLFSNSRSVACLTSETKSE